jgi:hypothetical protein
MPRMGFEPAVTASERPQTHAIDRAVTGISQVLRWLRLPAWNCGPVSACASPNVRSPPYINCEIHVSFIVSLNKVAVGGYEGE